MFGRDMDAISPIPRARLPPFEYVLDRCPVWEGPVRKRAVLPGPRGWLALDKRNEYLPKYLFEI